jgi:hypothetical protein
LACSNASNLKVNELSGDKKDFLVKALQASRQKFDTFLSYSRLPLLPSVLRV